MSTENNISPNKIAALMDSISEYAIFLLNKDGDIVLANKGAARIFQCDKKLIIGHFSNFCGVTLDRQKHVDDMLIDEAKNLGTAEHFGWRRRYDDKLFWAHVVLTPIHENEIITGYSAVVRDLTERRLSEAKYKKLLDTAPDAMVIVDEFGRINLINSQTEKLFGYSKMELLGKTIEILIPGAKHEQHIKQREQFIKEPHQRSMGEGRELFAKRKDGSLFPVEISLSPIETESGLLISSAIRDISGRIKINDQLKVAHQELKLAHKWIQGIIDGSQDLIAAIDIDLNLISFNQSYANFFQDNYQIVLQQPLNIVKLAEALPPSFSQIIDLWHKALTGMEFTHELKGKIAGVSRYFHLTFYPVKDQEGNLVGAAHIIRDTTEEKERESHIIANEARLKEAQQYAKMGSYEYDIENNLSFWSDGVFEILGFDKNQNTSAFEDFEKMVLPAYREVVINSVTNALFSKAPFKCEIKMIRPSDGKMIDLFLAGKFIKTSDEEKIIGILQDITESKAAENELATALAKAEETAKLKQEFLANMSHEIRTPMNVITGFSKILLQDQNIQGEEREYTQIIKNAGEDLLVIIDDILDFSKLEAGKFNIEKKPFDLSLCLKNLEKLFSLKAEERGLELVFITDPNVPPTLLGDAVRIKQLLTNLIANAIKFTPKGLVEIKTKLLYLLDNNCTISFSIKDSGIGIPEDKIELIFQSFQQAEGNTSRKYGGTGLGLAIVKNLLKLMNGQIWVESTPGSGSTFTVTLGFEVLPNLILEADKNLETTPETTPHLNILLAEDNRNNQILAKKVLSNYGFLVSIANNGQEAIDLMLQHEFDIILMDIQMPIMDGVQATIAIRALGTQKSAIPIIALTAHAMKEEKDRYLAVGMNAHINKPFNPEELIKTIISLAKPDFKSSETIVTPTSMATAIPNQKEIDPLAKLKEMIGDDPGIIREMLDIFCQDVPEYLATITKAKQEENWLSIAHTAHTLKSSLSFTIREDLVKLAELLQHQKTIPSEQGINEQLDYFVAELHKLVNEFEELKK